MFNRTLPIGSVVLLNDATKRIMILGYCQYKQGEMTKIYDYIGCTYPEGFVGADKMALFDQSQIKHIYALGFQNEEQFDFHDKLVVALESNEEVKKQKPDKAD